MYYNNPDCETQCEDLPYNGEYPSDGIQDWNAASPARKNAHISTRKDELLSAWKSTREPSMPRYFIHNQSLLSEPSLLIFPVITPKTIVTARKITTRETRIFLDCWYMAYSRTMMITCTIFQSSRHSWGTVTEYPPSNMVRTMKFVHVCTWKMIAPENFKYNYCWQSEDPVVHGTNLQLLQSIHWINEYVQNLTYPYIGVN